jgi:hypothetical protein
MSSHARLGIDWGDFAARLHASLAEHGPAPSPGHLRDILNTAHFASLEHEEGRPVTFALAFVDEPMLRAEGVNRKEWSPLVFARPLPFDVPSLAKLAAAVDHRQTLLAISDHSGSLVVQGLIRMNTMQYRSSRDELRFASGHGLEPLMVRATDAGVLNIDIGMRRFATIRRGQFLPEALPVFHGGRIFDELCAHAMRSGFHPSAYVAVLTRAILCLIDRGHGGIILLLPDKNLEYLDFRYELAEKAPALQEALRFISGDPLGPRAEVHDSLSGSRPDSNAVEVERAKQRAIEEHEFLHDAANFAADLASVDGALVLFQDLTIAGFGAHLVCESSMEMKTYRALDLNGTSIESSPLKYLGTRHNSTARLCHKRPGILGFVVSQDGVVSGLFRNPRPNSAADAVLLWRPVAMEHHW